MATRRRKNPGRADVIECVLKARWVPWERNRWALEVFVVGKWRGAGYVMAKKPRWLTKADLKKVAASVMLNTGGEYAVVDLELSEAQCKLIREG